MQRVHPDIKRAYTLPASFYQDRSIYNKLLDEFGNWWAHLLPSPEHGIDLSPGDVVPFKFYGEEVALACDKDSIVRCISNVCTHRGNVIVPHRERNTKLIRCNYHGRLFNMDGTFSHAPCFSNVKDFPCKSDNLKQLSYKRWGDVNLVSINPQVPFDEWIKPIYDHMPWLDIDKHKWDVDGSERHYINAHWALYCDNYLEGFHIPYVHKALHSVLDHNKYETILFDHGVLQVGIARDGESHFDIPAGSLHSGKKIAAFYFWIFPNLMLNFYPWGLSLNSATPFLYNKVPVPETNIQYERFILDKEKLNMGAGNSLGIVEDEDQKVVRGVASGIKSRIYKRGRFSPDKERGVHHFHRMLDLCTRENSMLLNVTLDEILRALDQFGGTATANEICSYLGFTKSWEREAIQRKLTGLRKVPIDSIGREYSIGGGRATWAYTRPK